MTRRGAIAIIVVGALLTLITIVLSITCHVGSPGEGESVGTIVNVANHGIIWKPPEAYLLHAGEMKAEEFGIEPSLVERVRGFQESGERVKVHYTSYLICARWNYASCTVVDAIAPDPIKPR